MGRRARVAARAETHREPEMTARRIGPDWPAGKPIGSPAAPGDRGKGHARVQLPGAQTATGRSDRPFRALMGGSDGPEGLQTLPPSDLSNLSNLFVEVALHVRPSAHAHAKPNWPETSVRLDRSDGASNRKAFGLSDLPARVGRVQPQGAFRSISEPESPPSSRRTGPAHRPPRSPARPRIARAQARVGHP